MGKAEEWIGGSWRCQGQAGWRCGDQLEDRALHISTLLIEAYGVKIASSCSHKIKRENMGGAIAKARNGQARRNV